MPCILPSKTPEGKTESMTYDVLSSPPKTHWEKCEENCIRYVVKTPLKPSGKSKKKMVQHIMIIVSVNSI